VTDQLRGFLRKRDEYDLATANAIRQLNLATPEPMRGVLWNQTGGTVTIGTTGAYVPLNIAGTLDADAAFNMEAGGSPNVTSLTNTTDQTRIVFVIGSFDARTVGTNTLGLRFSLNGTGVDATVCEAHNGFADRTAKLITHFIFRMGPGDTVGLECANTDSTANVSVDRYRLVAHAIR
jgi:hypothetical protein